MNTQNQKATQQLTDAQLDSISGGCYRRYEEEDSCEKRHCESDYEEKYESEDKYERSDCDYEYKPCHERRRRHHCW